MREGDTNTDKRREWETNTHRKRQRKGGRERVSVCIFFKRNVIALLLSIEVLIKV